jgi:hypothetical protein
MGLATTFLKTAIEARLEFLAPGRIKAREFKGEVDKMNPDTAQASLLLRTERDGNGLLAAQREVIVHAVAGWDHAWEKARKDACEISVTQTVLASLRVRFGNRVSLLSHRLPGARSRMRLPP